MTNPQQPTWMTFACIEGCCTSCDNASMCGCECHKDQPHAKPGESVTAREPKEFTVDEVIEALRLDGSLGHASNPPNPLSWRAYQELTDLRAEKLKLEQALNELREAISPGRQNRSPEHYVDVVLKMRQREERIVPHEG